MLKNAMKKTVSLIAAAVVLLSLFAFCASANSNALIYATDVNAKPNDTVTVQIMIDFNPGISNLRLFVDYNREYLALTNITDGGILGQTTHNNDLSADPCILYWTNSLKDDFTQNGLLATLEFKVKQGAPSGEYEIGLYFKGNNDCTNSKLSPVTVKLDNGIIYVQNENDTNLLSSEQTFTSSVISNTQSKPITQSNPNAVQNSSTPPSKTEQSNTSSTNNLSNNISSNVSHNTNSENSLTSNPQSIQDKSNSALFIALIAAAVAIALAIIIALRIKKKTT